MENYRCNIIECLSSSPLCSTLLCFFIIIVIIVSKCKGSFKRGHESLSDTEICAPMSFLLTTVCCHGDRRRRLVSKQVTFTKETSRCAVGPASIFWGLGAHQDLSFTRRIGISRAAVSAVRWELDSDVCAHLDLVSPTGVVCMQARSAIIPKCNLGWWQVGDLICNLSSLVIIIIILLSLIWRG